MRTLLLAVLFTSACSFCKDVKNVRTPRCELEAGTLDCGRLAEKVIVNADTALKIWEAISGNGANYIADLEAIAIDIGPGGWEFVTCEAAAIKRYFEEITKLPMSHPDKDRAPVVVMRADAALKLRPREVANQDKMPVFVVH